MALSDFSLYVLLLYQPLKLTSKTQLNTLIANGVGLISFSAKQLDVKKHTPKMLREENS
jgi:hypothetical protein